MDQQLTLTGRVVSARDHPGVKTAPVAMPPALGAWARAV
jgi:hypothetical protein